MPVCCCRSAGTCHNYLGHFAQDPFERDANQTSDIKGCEVQGLSSRQYKIIFFSFTTLISKNLIIVIIAISLDSIHGHEN